MNGENKQNKGNMAFKCNYNNGGKSVNSYGFNGVCSKAVIEYNIEKRKYEWCSSPECECRKFYNGKISREQLDEYFRNNGSVCYESSMMKDWAAGAGINHQGIKAGEPRTIMNAEIGGLAVLTTVLPNMPEEDRRIFAVFLIGDIFEGDDITEGYVVADPQYRISLTPRETNDLKFWDYYSNESHSEKCQWGSGLFRYLCDEEAAQILKQLSLIKGETKEAKLACGLMERFCKARNIDTSRISDPSGARTK